MEKIEIKHIMAFQMMSTMYIMKIIGTQILITVLPIIIITTGLLYQNGKHINDSKKRKDNQKNKNENKDNNII